MTTLAASFSNAIPLTTQYARRLNESTNIIIIILYTIFHTTTLYRLDRCVQHVSVIEASSCSEPADGHRIKEFDDLVDDAIYARVTF